MAQWKGCDGYSMNCFYLGTGDNEKELTKLRKLVAKTNADQEQQNSRFRYAVKIIRFKNGKVGYYWREIFDVKAKTGRPRTNSPI